jgi:hypothetical protein
VIDQRNLEARLPGSTGALGGVGGGDGQRKRFDELAAADLALLELGEPVRDEPFHDWSPLAQRRNAFSAFAEAICT